MPTNEDSEQRKSYCLSTLSSSHHQKFITQNIPCLFPSKNFPTSFFSTQLMRSSLHLHQCSKTTNCNLCLRRGAFRIILIFMVTESEEIKRKRKQETRVCTCKTSSLRWPRSVSINTIWMEEEGKREIETVIQMLSIEPWLWLTLLSFCPSLPLFSFLALMDLWKRYTEGRNEGLLRKERGWKEERWVNGKDHI